MDYEGELAIVIGRRAKRPGTRAASHILDTCANDVTARDLQPSDGQWSVAKGFDTFLPLGPCVNTEADPSHGLPIRTILNGRTVQNSNTRHLLFKPLWIVSWLSAVMTLLPRRRDPDRHHPGHRTHAARRYRFRGNRRDRTA